MLYFDYILTITLILRIVSFNHHNYNFNHMWNV